MGARLDCLTFHTWYWMQSWRVASITARTKGAKRRKRPLPLAPESEDGGVAAWLRLPPGVLFAGRLGIDLGVETNLALGGRRHL